MRIIILIIFAFLIFIHPSYGRADTSEVQTYLLTGLQFATGEDNTKKDMKLAAKLFKAAADKGSPEGQYLTGVCYERGDGVEKNFLIAIEWYLKAAEQEHVQAQLKLGVLYFTGNEVVQSYEDAAKWYRKAAAHGDQFSMYSLGHMYSSGLGHPQDFRLAEEWLQRAISTGGEYTQAAREALQLNTKSLELQASQQKSANTAREVKIIVEQNNLNSPKGPNNNFPAPIVKPQQSMAAHCTFSNQAPHPYASPALTMNCN